MAHGGDDYNKTLRLVFIEVNILLFTNKMTCDLVLIINGKIVRMMIIT